MNIIVGCLAKNEAGRFLESALRVWGEFADRIVLLDDKSEDGTGELAEEFGAIVYERGAGTAAWGAEAPARAELWDHLMAESEPGDWLFILDADMCPMRDPTPLFEQAGDAVAFRLFDLWHEEDDDLYYRSDGFWQAHVHHRTWAVRRPVGEPDDGWLWPNKGIHSGHLPTNLSQGQPLYAPWDFSLLHFGYLTPALRERKAAMYERVAEQLSPVQQQHALSILHPKPALHKVPESMVYYRLELASE